MKILWCCCPQGDPLDLIPKSECPLRSPGQVWLFIFIFCVSMVSPPPPRPPPLKWCEARIGNYIAANEPAERGARGVLGREVPGVYWGERCQGCIGEEDQGCIGEEDQGCKGEEDQGCIGEEDQGCTGEEDQGCIGEENQGCIGEEDQGEI